MLSVLVTLETFQPSEGWLKLLAALNMFRMLVILETFHVPKGWLKLLALKNMLRMSGALATFNAPKGWLKLPAHKSMLFMSVTLQLATFHPPKGWLKLVALLNMLRMLVTLATPHSEISSLESCWFINIQFTFVTSHPTPQCHRTQSGPVPGCAGCIISQQHCEWYCRSKRRSCAITLRSRRPPLVLQPNVFLSVSIHIHHHSTIPQ